MAMTVSDGIGDGDDIDGNNGRADGGDNDDGLAFVVTVVVMSDNDADGVGHDCSGDGGSVGNKEGICGDSSSGD